MSLMKHIRKSQPVLLVRGVISDDQSDVAHTGKRWQFTGLRVLLDHVPLFPEHRRRRASELSILINEKNFHIPTHCVDVSSCQHRRRLSALSV